MRLTIRSKFWIEQDGELVLSDWRVELLEAIQEAGSLAAASSKLNVPYRVAWGKIKEIEGRLGFPLLESKAGGVSGGSTQLTARGQELIARYRLFQTNLPDIIQQRFAEVFDTE